MGVQEMPLKKELETYNAHRDKLVAESEGKFVVISGDEVLGVWSTYEDALTAGYEQYELQPFLVKRIEAIERVHYIMREIR